jgi:hypothetical protein
LPEEGGCGSDGDEGLGDGGKLLVVAGEAGVLDQAGQAAFHDPAARKNLEALAARAALDDRKRDVSLLLGPLHQLPGIAAIGEDAGDEGVAPTRGLEHQPGPVAVLDGGGMSLGGEQPAVAVRQDVALAAPDLLAGVIALKAPF